MNGSRHEVPEGLQVFSGRSHPALAESVADELGVELSQCNLEPFSNGEGSVQLGPSVRGDHVFIMQTHGGTMDVDKAINEQAFMIDAARRASAERVTAICPYFGYSRQDRKAKGREPISAAVVTRILGAADRLVSIDLHSGQIQGFFDGPFDHLTAAGVLVDYIKENLMADDPEGDDLVVVAPDAGRAKVAEKYQETLGGNTGFAIINKRRSKTEKSRVEATGVSGEKVKGKRCVLIDDMIDTGGTIMAAARVLKDKNASEITVMTTHAIFSDPAPELLGEDIVDRIVVTDTIPLRPEAEMRKLKVVTVAPLIAKAVSAIYDHGSVSEIFGGNNLF